MAIVICMMKHSIPNPIKTQYDPDLHSVPHYKRQSLMHTCVYNGEHSDDNHWDSHHTQHWLQNIILKKWHNLGMLLTSGVMLGTDPSPDRRHPDTHMCQNIIQPQYVHGCLHKLWFKCCVYLGLFFSYKYTVTKSAKATTPLSYYFKLFTSIQNTKPLPLIHHPQPEVF